MKSILERLDELEKNHAKFERMISGIMDIVDPPRCSAKRKNATNNELTEIKRIIGVE